MNDRITTKTPAEDAGGCRQSGCTVAVNGECYEGITDFTTCPNYVLYAGDDSEQRADETDDTETDDEDYSGGEIINPPQADINLYKGNELDYASSLRITRAALTKVIVLAGANNSGKTTLLNSIYEHFLEHSIGDYLFAGSETLAPFDQRCHLSRTDSGRETEDTERTKSFSEQTMLHLRVRHKSLAKPIQNLLLSDIRGELFKKAIDSQTEAQRIKILKRADHLAILVDGSKIADIRQRNQAAVVAQMALRSFLEAGMIGKQTLVEVLFNKDDLMQKADWDRIQELLKRLESEIRQKHEQKVGHISFHRIIARSEEGVKSQGVTEIFHRWVEDSAILEAKTTPRDSRLTVSSPREFDRFALVQMPDGFTESPGQSRL